MVWVCLTVILVPSSLMLFPWLRSGRSIVFIDRNWSNFNVTYIYIYIYIYIYTYVSFKLYFHGAHESNFNLLFFCIHVLFSTSNFGYWYWPSPFFGRAPQPAHANHEFAAAVHSSRPMVDGWWLASRVVKTWWKWWVYPLVICYIAIEHGHL